jgi:hypothetical protein
VDNLIQEQAAQVQKFEAWAARKNWFEFHRNHFDWWTFPIDRGSTGYGFKYDISGEPLNQLREKPEYIKSLRRAAALYLQSMAWDLKKHDWVPNPDFDRGQDPTAHINQQRLFKIGRSLQLHGLEDEFTSVREMVQSLRSAGYRTGNENFWDDPDRFSMRTSFVRNPGISGSMAVGIRPKNFDGYDGGPQRDPRKEPKFIAKWAAIDIAINDFFTKSKKGKAPTPPVPITFDWRDDASRVEYLNQIESGKIRSGFAKFGNGKPNPKSRNGLGKTLSANIGLLKGLGLLWGTQGKSHGAFYHPFGIFLVHSSSASNPDTANGEQVRDLLGLLDKEINPSQYWDYFENWIRNPYATMRDQRTGSTVGVRLYFKNDYEKMAAEFERRIQELRDSISEEFGKSITQREDSQILQNEKPEKLNPFAESKITNLLNEKDIAKRFKDVESVKHMADAIGDALLLDGVKISSPQLEELLKSRYSNLLEDKLREHPNFLKRTLFDSLTESQYREGKLLMSFVHEEIRGQNIEPSDLNIDAVKQVYFPEPYYTREIVEKLHQNQLNNGIFGAMSIASSHIKTVDAENTTANPENPRSFINHVTSTPSSYLSLQEATDDLEEAKRTGRPISWLIPGQLHPEINEEYNKLVEDVMELGVTDTISLNTPEHTMMPSRKPSKAEISAQDKAVEAFNKFSHRYALIFQTKLHMLGVTDNSDSRQMAYGLVQRASTDAARANYLAKRFNSTEMTPEILDELKDDTEDVFGSIDFNAPETVNVTVPASVLEKIFADGRLKTQHETKSSMGALNPDLRNIQEFAMFSIHPAAKQRPIYGTVRRGLTEDNVINTAQYGAATIVLKGGNEKRTTWTQADSLSQQATASTLAPGMSTWDGMHNQSIHQKTKDAYFYSREVALALEELGAPLDERGWPFIEAQIHNGVSVDDISHIVVDEDWFQSYPEMVAPEFGAEFDENNWMESPKWVQISQIAESLNIPIVLLREGLADSEVLEEPEN